jgi:hypothetical protein
MSAYIVDKMCIDRIINYLFWNKDLYCKLKNYRTGYSVSHALKHEGWKEDEDADENKLGKDLFRMNADAVAQRYDEKPDYSSANEYRFADLKPVSIAQAWQSARCLRYQCSEGNVPKRKLFKELNEFADELANKMATERAEAEKAEWG